MSRVLRHVMTGLVSILLDAMLLRSGSRVLLLLLSAPPAAVYPQSARGGKRRWRQPHMQISRALPSSPEAHTARSPPVPPDQDCHNDILLLCQEIGDHIHRVFTTWSPMGIFHTDIRLLSTNPSVFWLWNTQGFHQCFLRIYWGHLLDWRNSNWFSCP